MFWIHAHLSIHSIDFNIFAKPTVNYRCSEEFDRPESRLSFVKNKAADLKTDFSKLSLLNDENNKKMETLANRLDGAYGGCEDEKVHVTYFFCSRFKWNQCFFRWMNHTTQKTSGEVRCQRGICVKKASVRCNPVWISSRLANLWLVTTKWVASNVPKDTAVRRRNPFIRMLWSSCWFTVRRLS